MFKYKNILIYGYSTSGKAVERVLITMDVNYKIYDDNMRLGGGKYLFKLHKEEIKKFDLIVISPAISIFNKHVKFAESEGVRVISELEFGFLMCNVPIIAITGTNGKTTVTKLVEHVLNSSKLKVKALGNVGEPLSSVVNYKNLDYVICEVSSFQLEAIYKFKPYIGMILNIDSDHIDRHKTLQNYVNLKTSLFKNCDKLCYAILNNQPEILTNLKDTLANKIVLNHDCKLENNKVVFNGEEVLQVADINDFTYLENILAAVCVFKLLKLTTEQIVMGINTFKSLKHRLEFVDKVNEISFYDDSKATNPHATLGAVCKLNLCSDIVLLLGGKDKNLNFNSLLKQLPKNITKVVAFGEARKKIYKQSKLYFPSSLQPNLKAAFYEAFNNAKANSTILLSPACASFDEFKNYEERGDYFKQLVKEVRTHSPTEQPTNGVVC